jgi:spectinomycin phosphotransferase
MLEKPEIKDESIIDALHNQFNLPIASISFLPIGADHNTAVYQAVTRDEIHYFVKLRRGAFDPLSALIPNYLRSQGMAQVIPVIPTQSGNLWTVLDEFTLVLYPFINGHDGYYKELSEEQWNEFGRALKHLHSVKLPPSLSQGFQRETFTPRWGQKVRIHLESIQTRKFRDPVARELSTFLRTNLDLTQKLIDQAAQLALEMQKRPFEYVVCHGDIHGWNLFIDDEQTLFIVDWDTLILAPKERDLMFIGAGLGSSGYAPHEEEKLFYRCYGNIDLYQNAIAYYRSQRILEDIAICCDQILLSDEGGKDRERAITDLMSNYYPGGTIEMAFHAHRS